MSAATANGTAQAGVDYAAAALSGQTFPPGTPLSQIPGVTPKNNPNPSETILYVNGIMTPMDGQLHEAPGVLR